MIFLFPATRKSMWNDDLTNFLGVFSQKIPQKSWLTGQNRNPRPIWLPPFCQMMKQIIMIQTFWWTKTDQILSKCTIAHYQRLSSSEYYKNSVKSQYELISRNIFCTWCVFNFHMFSVKPMQCTVWKKCQNGSFYWTFRLISRKMWIANAMKYQISC